MSDCPSCGAHQLQNCGCTTGELSRIELLRQERDAARAECVVLRETIAALGSPDPLGITQRNIKDLKAARAEVERLRRVTEAAKIYFEDDHEFFKGLNPKWFRRQQAVREALAALEANSRRRDIGP